MNVDVIPLGVYMRACLITTLLLLVAPGCNPPPPEAKAHASEAVAGSEGMVLSVDLSLIHI